jgi:hypothetical protein
MRVYEGETQLYMGVEEERGEWYYAPGPTRRAHWPDGAIDEVITALSTNMGYFVEFDGWSSALIRLVLDGGGEVQVQFRAGVPESVTPVQRFIDAVEA